jgi:two-component system, OmpR family, response regulator
MQLEVSGHDVRSAHNGADALRMARATLPDVVVLDLGLPDMSGCEVAKQLRSRPELKETILIALSGRSTPEDKRSAVEAGCDYYLVKPVSVGKLEALFPHQGKQSLQTD